MAAVGLSAERRPLEGSYMPCFLAGVGAAAAFAPRGFRSAKPPPAGACRRRLRGGRRAGRPAPLDAALVTHVLGPRAISAVRGVRRSCLGGEAVCAGPAVDRLGVQAGVRFPAGAEVSRLAADAD